MQRELGIQKLEAGQAEHFAEVVRLFEDVFEMQNFKMPPLEHLSKLLTNKDFFVFAAYQNNKLVGGLTAYVMEQYYSTKPLAYIFDLAVDTKCQRQGIGRKLVGAVNQFCTEQGFEEVFVQADQVDEYALDFYRSTRPTEEEKVVHFYYTLEGSQVNPS